MSSAASRRAFWPRLCSCPRALFYARIAGWATVGEAQPTLHAGAELAVRTDILTLFAQVQLEDRLGCSPVGPLCAWGLVGTFGLSFPDGAFPKSAHISLGRGAAPWMLFAVQGGVTYDVSVHARHGDGHAAMERFWDRALGPLRYRWQLRRRGYYDPYPDEQGLLRDELDHSVLGLIGIPDPTRPGYILTPSGVSIPVGASLEIRGDRPFVASPAFPGRVLTYIPLLALTRNGGALTRPIFDPSYFALLEAERQREELAVQDELRRMDSPWAKAALNAAVRPLLEPLLLFLAAASPDTPDLPTLLHQAQLVPYRDGYEEYKGEIAETLLLTYGSLLAGGLGPLRAVAATNARELAAGLGSLRATLGSASRAPQLLTRLAPRLNPGNYQLQVRGLGSNFGNLRLGYTSAEPVEQLGPASASRVRTPQEVGALREEQVAAFTEGRLANRPGEGMKIKVPGLGSTDVDVIGRNGELICVGGPAKARDLAQLGQKIQRLKIYAEQNGKIAQYYFTDSTPDSAVNLARRWLGEENVFVFRESF